MENVNYLFKKVTNVEEINKESDQMQENQKVSITKSPVRDYESSTLAVTLKGERIQAKRLS